MKRSNYFVHLIVLWLVFASPANAGLHVGVGSEKITPPIGTPSAGYTDRNGRGMEGANNCC